MRTLIDELDVKNLQGQFCVELNDNNANVTFYKSPDFWLEKRIKFISILPEGFISLGGFYYTTEKISVEEFIKKWNGTNNRHFRLLTKKELEWLAKEMFSLRIEKNII